MTNDWQADVRAPRRTAATFLPPANIDETAWDILLALHSDRRCELGLQKLCCIVSVAQRSVYRWLAALEERALVSAARVGFTQELRAVLTPAGRELIDRYLSATNDLQVGTRQ